MGLHLHLFFYFLFCRYGRDGTRRYTRQVETETPAVAGRKDRIIRFPFRGSRDGRRFFRSSFRYNERRLSVKIIMENYIILIYY